MGIACAIFMLGCFVAVPEPGNFRMLVEVGPSGEYHIDEYELAVCADQSLPDAPLPPEAKQDTAEFLARYDAYHAWELRWQQRQTCRNILGGYEAGKRDARPVISPEERKAL